MRCSWAIGLRAKRASGLQRKSSERRSWESRFSNRSTLCTSPRTWHQWKRGASMTDVETTKRCRACGEEKPVDEFHNSVASVDGKYARCKPCVVEKNRRWRESNPETVRQSKK